MTAPGDMSRKSGAGLRYSPFAQRLTARGGVGRALEATAAEVARPVARLRHYRAAGLELRSQVLRWNHLDTSLCIGAQLVAKTAKGDIESFCSVSSVSTTGGKGKNDMLSYCLGECCVIFHDQHDLTSPWHCHSGQFNKICGFQICVTLLRRSAIRERSPNLGDERGQATAA